jgi:putative redox protein
MPDTLNAEVTWRENLQFVATTGSGHELVLDASAEFGGEDAGPRPMEMLLVGNAGCTGMDVVSILKKMRQPVVGYRVRVTGHRRQEEPRIFTRIVIEHILQGDLEEDKVAHAVELSEQKYCSASAMLGAVAEMDVSWRIEP